MAKIVWREWYNEPAVKKMEEMGTIPRYETEIDIADLDGEEVAMRIAEEANKEDSLQFREGGEIVILSPESYAGTYDISVDYVPTFYASARDD